MSSISGLSGSIDYYFSSPIRQYGVSDASSIDYLFSSTTNTQDQLDGLANSALSGGIDRYTKNDYARAILEFKRSLLLSPSSDNSSKAYDYLAQAYLKLGKNDEAIKTYQQAIDASPMDDTFHLSLGDIYYKAGKLKEAQAEYFKAVQLNSTSPDNHYSLGQTYLTSGRLSEAQAQFTKVTQLAQTSPAGFYGLGQVFRQSRHYTDALAQLNKAVAMNKTFANAFLELGYTYADMGDMDKAQEQLDTLNKLGASSQSTKLQIYLTQTANPKISQVYSTGGFSATEGPRMAVSALDSTLSSPNAAKDFTMNFIFSKDMDTNSVQSLANWQIGRQSGAYISRAYNFGMPLPSTEVTLPVRPKSVVYNPDNKTAVVSFTISQNDAGDGTIDPSHVSFKFTGKDTYGKLMDPTADEYSGFSLIV
jgi:tetratricopeptide (TPR) repeat protein